MGALARTGGGEEQMIALLAASHPLPSESRSAFLEQRARLGAPARDRRRHGASRRNAGAEALFRSADGSGKFDRLLENLVASRR
jgi:hypothetical protein